MIVTLQHLRTVPTFNARPGYCLPQARVWCASHDIDFRDFVRNGVDEDRLSATGDGFALALVAWAHECERAHG